MHKCSILIVIIILIAYILHKYDVIKMHSRQLFIDHVAFTREYLFAVAQNQPSDGSVARLMKNQDQIGQFLGRFYGKDFGVAAATLLKTHIGLVAKVVSGDKSSITAMYQNGDQIADALAIPRAHMKDHLDLTVAEYTQMKNDIVSDTQTNFDAYDKVYKEIIGMSDHIVKKISYVPWRLMY